MGVLVVVVVRNALVVGERHSITFSISLCSLFSGPLAEKKQVVGYLCLLSRVCFLRLVIPPISMSRLRHELLLLMVGRIGGPSSTAQTKDYLLEFAFLHRPYD